MQYCRGVEYPFTKKTMIDISIKVSVFLYKVLTIDLGNWLLLSYEITNE